MKKYALDPAASIIKALGGEERVSQVTSTNLTAPYRWQMPIERGGTGGQIPTKHIPSLLAHAKSEGISSISAASFFAEPEVAA